MRFASCLLHCYVYLSSVCNVCIVRACYRKNCLKKQIENGLWGIELSHDRHCSSYSPPSNYNQPPINIPLFTVRTLQRPSTMPDILPCSVSMNLIFLTMYTVFRKTPTHILIHISMSDV